jgi:hypothetical protein
MGGGGGEEAVLAEALHLALIGKAMCTLSANKGTCTGRDADVYI